MPINLSSLAPLTTKVTAVSNLLLVTPTYTGYEPQNPPDPNSFLPSFLQSPPGLLFHYEGDQTAALESDITDHFVEDNTAVQDQIALRPVTITTHGFIGELNNVAPFGLQTLKTIADKLTVIGPYAPQISITAQLAYNQAFQLYQLGANALNAGVSAVSSLLGGGTQNKQQQMFAQFYGYWQKRTLFTCQTPWCKFDNMAIKTLRAIQDADTRVITDFEITFKQIRYAQTGFLSTALAGRAASQASSLINQGTSTGTPGPSVGSGISSTVSP